MLISTLLDILALDILGLDILGLDILGLDILGMIQNGNPGMPIFTGCVNFHDRC